MKRIVIILVLFLLSGCIAEEYDFTPPTVSLTHPYADQIELEEANINWDSDKEYSKETEDIYALAKEQEQKYYSSGEQVRIDFDNQDFLIEDLSAYLWQNGSKTELQVEDQEFSFPDEEGKYLIVVDLLSDNGSAQYVGNIILEEQS
ncbi:hypothetical protein [Halobacillus salinus]|uniref:hypothetical protein n=1 Tax=Halobacillus salinus TaxID=192814 RepID=UPI0009A6D118|nr:hypothetical protein [Halobacillus salinus]